MANLKQAPKSREDAPAKGPNRNTSIVGQNYLFTPRGTHDIHILIVGRDITGLDAFGAGPS